MNALILLMSLRMSVVPLDDGVALGDVFIPQAEGTRAERGDGTTYVLSIFPLVLGFRSIDALDRGVAGAVAMDAHVLTRLKFMLLHDACFSASALSATACWALRTIRV